MEIGLRGPQILVSGKMLGQDWVARVLRMPGHEFVSSVDSSKPAINRHFKARHF